MNNNNPCVFEIKHIYLKDVSFESPQTPVVFKQPANHPDIDIDVNVNNKAINEEQTLFDVILMLRVTTKADDKVLFLVEIKQAGIFEVSGFNEEDAQQILNIATANALLPFARETISSLVSKGGFPQLLIRPLNFEAIYRKKIKLQAQHKQSKLTEAL